MQWGLANHRPHPTHRCSLSTPWWLPELVQQMALEWHFMLCTHIVYTCCFKILIFHNYIIPSYYNWWRVKLRLKIIKNWTSTCIVHISGSCVALHTKKFAHPCHIVMSEFCVYHSYYRSYASAVLGVLILSVRLSVCVSHACFVTEPNNVLWIFWYHTKGQSLCFSDTNSGWRATPLPSEICAQSEPPLRKTPTSTDFCL